MRARVGKWKWKWKTFVSAFVCVRCVKAACELVFVHSHFSNLLSPLSVYIGFVSLFSSSFLCRNKNSSLWLIIIIICWASQLLPCRYEFYHGCVCLCTCVESPSSSFIYSLLKIPEMNPCFPSFIACNPAVCVCTTHSISCSYCYPYSSMLEVRTCAMSFHKFFDVKCERINLQISSSN